MPWYVHLLVLVIHLKVKSYNCINLIIFGAGDANTYGACLTHDVCVVQDFVLSSFDICVFALLLF